MTDYTAVRTRYGMRRASFIIIPLLFIYTVRRANTEHPTSAGFPSRLLRKADRSRRADATLLASEGITMGRGMG